MVIWCYSTQAISTAVHIGTYMYFMYTNHPQRQGSSMCTYMYMYPLMGQTSAGPLITAEECTCTCTVYMYMYMCMYSMCMYTLVSG